MRFWLFSLALPLAAQTFEVASIRLYEGPPIRSSICHNMKAGTENVQAAGYLNLLVIDAYEMDADRFDLPDWGRNPQFEVKAKLPPNTDADGCRAMLKALLAERFHLVTAVEIQQLPTYFLKAAKTGLKLKPVDALPPDPRGGVTSKSENGRKLWTFRGSPFARIAGIIEAGVVTGSMAGVLEADRLVDETGLTGSYDGELEYQHTTPAGQLSQAPSLKDALLDRLGLTLDLRKAPRKVLVIRSSDRVPAEN